MGIEELSHFLALRRDVSVVLALALDLKTRNTHTYIHDV